MTGEKNRYSSVEKLWKLDDETLKTPRHDEMVIWLLNKNNIKSLFQKETEEYDKKEQKMNETLRGCGAKEEIANIKIESEVPIMAKNNFLVGYWDIVAHGRGIDAYIEVKPVVDSFGATLRQIKTYQEYASTNEYGEISDYIYKHTYLFTDDLRFKEPFESQGIKVIDAKEARNTGGRAE